MILLNELKVLDSLSDVFMGHLDSIRMLHIQTSTLQTGRRLMSPNVKIAILIAWNKAGG